MGDELKNEKYIIWAYSANEYALFLRTKNNNNDVTTDPRKAYVFNESEVNELESKHAVNKVNIKVFDLNLGLIREKQDGLFKMTYVRHDDFDLLEIMRKEIGGNE